MFYKMEAPEEEHVGAKCWDRKIRGSLTG
jgi:hypothetical protein